ncbi:N-acetylmuramoyl-L-alanine amidase [Cellulosimicrobium sp. TH-20]|uniref:peptidoglycan recognition protein family protein n=1 Tax=Cellulosimicrobium sp. TH-20 TaxID=1980001 RepID=UPI0011A15391|nr:N-acetylmuramoyl-L-alanine amidase [Cellulosimicrobium sp. TH-20]
MVYIEPRHLWGARHANGDLNLSGLASEVFIHHTVTTQLLPTATVEQERAQMRSIESIGQNRFGTGISYNVIVFPSGRAYEGVSFNRRGTHTGGRNSTTRSICFAGNYEAHEPSAAALATAAAIIAEGRGTRWKAGAPVRAHRELKSTSCPGRFVFAQLGYLASGATQVGNEVKPVAPAPAPSKTPEQLYNAGFSVAEIKATQEKLNRLGYRLAVDGIRGPKSQTAIKDFQSRNGLTVDGYPGPATQAKLDARLAPAAKPAPSAGRDLYRGCKGEDVKALQRRLNRDYPAYSKLAVDGSFGPAVEAVVREFQRRSGLKVDGIAGPATRRALGL